MSSYIVNHVKEPTYKSRNTLLTHQSSAHAHAHALFISNQLKLGKRTYCLLRAYTMYIVHTAQAHT